MNAKDEIAVVGHTCVDLIPRFLEAPAAPADLFVPGKLQIVGPAAITTGGVVANTGLTLHRFGIPVRLMGKVGADDLGRTILQIFRAQHPRLADDMLVQPGEHTSYTIVLNPPGHDRMFLHYPGTNDTFCAADARLDRLAPGTLLHFGYPPLMRRFFIKGGRELETLLRRAKARGLVTSLDLAQPDPGSEAGRVDWIGLLRRVLPHVDLFLPSLDELVFMFDAARFRRLQRPARAGRPARDRLENLVAEMSSRLLDLGARVVLLKLGDRGLYLRTVRDVRRLAFAERAGPAFIRAWAGRELLAPCFKVRVAGTTGSGDRTVAGFLIAWRARQAPAAALTLAVAVGACSVEALDPHRDIPALARIRARIRGGWTRRPVSLTQPRWRWDRRQAVWVGPADAGCADT